MIFCGIGSRKLSSSLRAVVTRFADLVVSTGDHGYSGGAMGSDDEFERAAERAGTPFTTFIPKPGFRERSVFQNVEHILVQDLDNYRQAYEMASKIHPAWGILTEGERNLHARNCYEVLGITLRNPVDYTVLCAPPSKDGKSVVGGTNSAFQLSKLYGVPCFNIYTMGGRLKLHNFLKSRRG